MQPRHTWTVPFAPAAGFAAGVVGERMAAVAGLASASRATGEASGTAGCEFLTGGYAG
jgi:hypothetical protein